MQLIYFIKWANHRQPEKWVRSSFEEFWHDLREFMLRNTNTGPLEWIIRE